MNVDRSTITNIIPELLNTGIVTESDQKPTGKGGRPPSPLSINPHFGYTIGISIHLQGFRATILDLNGSIIETIIGDLPYKYDAFTNNTLAILNQLIANSKKYEAPLIGAVVAISGTINPRMNSIEHSFVFNLDLYDFQKEIADKFPFPVLIENDANACAWGELFPHNRYTHSTFLYLLARTTAYNTDKHADTGMAIGVGLVADGKLMYGAHYRAGELRSALWEERVGIQNQVSIPISQLTNIHQNQSVLVEFINEILISLGPVVSVTDPEAIIFGGDLKDKVPIILHQLQTSKKLGFLGSEFSRYKIITPSKGVNEISAGAASMFLIRLFKQDFGIRYQNTAISWDVIFNLETKNI